MKVAVDGYSSDEEARIALYLPTSPQEPGTTLLIRVNGDPEAAIRRLDTVLTARAPGALEQIFNMQTFADFRMYPFRAAYWVSTAVGLLALLLTIPGFTACSRTSSRSAQRRSGFAWRSAQTCAT